MKHLRSILILPGVVLVIIPALIVALNPQVNIGWQLKPPLNLIPIFLGGLLILIGIFSMIHTIRLFAAIGRGTLAPWDPTQKLVVAGLYRYMRNPMIAGVGCVLLGEAVLLGSAALFVWFALFLVINIIYLSFSEEPSLEKRFGEDYQVYKTNVPRWLPRRTPWEGPSGQDTDRY